ncbi:hypothetical protein LJC12_01115 [Odoribacter sp. OttesenSCG-928-J03]|nr:hypothetical protein [Odoribacter sp. OttesenSCG-928-J03]MDL2282929.1 hypothetical protein [Odoribacter sp. OttesenSCG-928-G04]MDL2330895.1 hypothetical protein [Odoribacter sp. OttesenSCG-928-A06]
MNLELADYLLIALLLFAVMSFPFLKKFLSLCEIFVKSHVQKGLEERNTTAKGILNLRLLAYERMVLFIERIKPDSLIPRTLSASLNNREYHQILLSEIRKEYEYNMSQQLYMTHEAWTAITNLKNDMVTLINTVAVDCQPDQPASGLAQKVLEHYITADLRMDEILSLLKSDVNALK